MSYIVGDRVYNIAYDSGRIISLQEKYVFVKYETIDVPRKYPVKALDKVLFRDKEICKKTVKSLLPNIDSDGLLIGVGYEGFRRVKEFVSLSNVLVQKKSELCNKAIKDICHKVSIIDESLVSMFIPVVGKMISIGDWVTALDIIFENGLNSCFNAAVDMMLSKSTDTALSLEKLEKKIQNENIDFIPILDKYISNYNGEHCDWIESKKQIKIQIKRDEEFNAYKEKFERTLKGRKINYLLHFTQIDNIPSILKHGIVPPVYHSDLNIVSLKSDADWNNYRTSLSIEYPNYLMFYVKRNEVINSKWAIIYIDSNVLLDENVFFSRKEPYLNETPFAFYSDNAKSAGGRYRVDELKDMFAPQVVPYRNQSVVINRKDLNIPDNYTTNPQAEICSCVTIPPEYIRYVKFGSEGVRKAFVDKYKSGMDPRFVVDYNLFARRCDYKIWMTEGGYGNGTQTLFSSDDE